MKKFKVFGIVVGAILLFFGLFIALFYFRFIYNDFPKYDYSEPANQAKAFWQDLDYLKNYADFDVSFANNPEKKALFLEIINEAQSRVDTLTKGEFELYIAKAVAVGDNAHSNVSATLRTTRVNLFPMHFWVFSDGVYILRAKKEFQEFLGHKILAVNNIPVEDVLKTFMPHSGGPDQYKRRQALYFMSSPELLHAAGIGQASERASLTLQDSNGNVFEAVFDAITSDPNKSLPGSRATLAHYRKPETMGMFGEWVHLMKGVEAPLYLSYPHEIYIKSYLEEQDIYYVEILGNYDELADFLSLVEQEIISLKPKYVIVDLRFNGGGNSDTTPFAERLPKILPENGKIFVITSDHTFSYGLGAAAQFKYHGKEKTFIVGEPVGDRLIFYATGGEELVLPNHGIGVRVWKAKEDFHNGCTSITECFWFAIPESIKVDNLDPDIPVEFTFEEYSKGIDPMVEAILKDIE